MHTLNANYYSYKFMIHARLSGKVDVLLAASFSNCP